MNNKGNKKRTTVYLDEELHKLKNQTELNLSEYLNQKLKEKLSSVKLIKEQKNELKQKLKELHNQKKEIEEKIEIYETRFNDISEIISFNNNFLDEIEKDEYLLNKFNGAINRIKNADDKNKAININAEVLVEKYGFPYSKKEIKEFFEKYLKNNMHTLQFENAS